MRITSSLAAVALAISSFSFSAPAHADAGDAVVGGALGFAVGTIFGNATAQPRRPRYYPGTVYVAPPPPPPTVVYRPAPVYYAPEPWTPDWYAYCAQRFDSFDARSGTYLGYDGYRHMCH
jgi:hypothetical protein